MQYLPKVKFQAALVSGDIVPGAAFAGHDTTAFDTVDFGLYHCLLEDPVTNNWEICRYDPAAASGFRRQTVYSCAAGALAANLTGLTCSFVAHPNSYVVNTHELAGDNAPIARSLLATAVGAKASIGTGSESSLAISGTVPDNSPRSVVVGEAWTGQDSVAIGFYADAQDKNNQGDYLTYSRRGSVALGANAASSVAGEVALGSSLISHMSGAPIMTDDPSAGGTFLFRAVSTNNGAFVLHDILANSGTYLPGDGGGGGNAFGNWVVHVQGTIVARATSAANDKVVKVEWVTGGTLTQTVLTQGANNISLGLALNGMRLQATVGAVAGLTLSGYLHFTKITW